MAGIYANSSGSSVNLSLKAPVISGFSTGITAVSSTGATVSTTGGSIAATGTGISAGATSGTVDIESQSAITALTGISATSPGPIQIITSGTGTLDSTSPGTGTGISVATNGTGTVNVSVGAAIGGTTTFGRGVSVITSNPASALINFSNTAAIHVWTASSLNYGVYLQAWSFPTGQNGALTVGADITGGSGVYTSGGAYDYVVLSGATITAAATNGVGINSGNTRSSLTNAGTITATGTGGIGADIAGIGGVVNTGTIHGAARGISLLNSTTINNQGTISGGTSAGIYGAAATIYNVGTTSLITGDTGITTTNNPTGSGELEA